MQHDPPPLTSEWENFDTILETAWSEQSIILAFPRKEEQRDPHIIWSSLND
jgi:hypothetical protein